MKAAVLHQPLSDLVIEDVQVGTPGPREVLIRTKACGVCHSDLHFIDALYPAPIPLVPGHEAAGVVEAVGEDVTAIRPGDHVVTCFSTFCGRCEYCVTGRLSLCTDASTRRRPDEPPRVALGETGLHQLLNVGGYAEQLLVHENGAVAIDRDMPFDRAALMGCAVVTGAGAVRIVTIDPVPAKRELAEKLGATDSFDANDPDLRKKVIALTKGGVHHAIEAVGKIAAGELALSLLRRGGTATIVGMMPMSETLGMRAVDLLAEKKLQGSLMGSNRFPVDIPRLVDFYLAGRLDLDSLIAERIPLSGINGALQKLRTGEAARSVVIFD